MSRRPPRLHLASFLSDFTRYGDQTAIVALDGLRQVRTTYGGLAKLAHSFASELDDREIRKGDRVLIWGENSAAWLAAFFGCLERGVIAVPLDIAGSADFARRVAADVSPKLAVGGRDRLSALHSAVPCLSFDEFPRALASDVIPSNEVDLKPTDPFQIIFTSGTTGEPKGVVHTHKNVLASVQPIEEQMQPYMKYERVFHPLRFLHTLPLSHVFGQFMGIWIPALFAAEVHFDQRLAPGGMIEKIRTSRISVVAAVPRVLDILRDHLRTRIPDLETRLAAGEPPSPLKRWTRFFDVHRLFGLKFWAFVCGGATLPDDLEKFWSALGFAVVQGYGMTETAALISLNHPFRRARGSIGKVLPGREVRIRDDGEILVRGDTVSTTTWEGGRLRERDSEWLETGDLASVDEQGNLRYRGRKKDVIVTSAGLNIYPEDLEAALQTQPQVKACAVVQTEGRTGPEPIAALVVRDEAEAAEAVRAANRNLADFQKIRRWVVWPDADLPRTSTGKVLRREVARSLNSPTDGHTAMAGDALSAIIHRITGADVSKFSDDASLSEDLHLDSLARVELLANLEMHFGLEMEDTEWQAIKTLGDLRRRLREGARHDQQQTAAPPSRTRHHYPAWTLHPAQQLIRVAFLETMMRGLVRFLAAPRVERKLAAEPRERVLIVSNHITAYDVPLVLYGLPRRMRDRVAVGMGAELLMDMRKGRKQGSRIADLFAPFGYFLITAWFNVFPLPQRGDFRESFAFAAKAMDRGYHVLVFPEGRRTKDLEMHTFEGGAGLLWSQLRCNALPVFIEGLARIKVEHRPWFRSGELTVHVGDIVPFTPDPEQGTRTLEAAVRALIPR